jgi:hypothetical protein
MSAVFARQELRDPLEPTGFSSTLSSAAQARRNPATHQCISML